MSASSIMAEDLFLDRARLAAGQRPLLACRLRTLIMPFLRTSHTPSQMGGTVCARVQEMDVLYMTPFCRLEGMPGRYGVDVWVRAGPELGKVAGLWWEDEGGEVKIVKLRRGAWIGHLLKEAGRSRRG